MSKTYEEILQDLKTSFENVVQAWDQYNALHKTPSTKAITIHDWNYVIDLMARTDAYVRATYPLISGLGDLGTRLKDEVSKLKSDTESLKNVTQELKDATASLHRQTSGLYQSVSQMQISVQTYWTKIQASVDTVTDLLDKTTAKFIVGADVLENGCLRIYLQDGTHVDTANSVKGDPGLSPELRITNGMLEAKDPDTEVWYTIGPLFGNSGRFEFGDNTILTDDSAALGTENVSGARGLYIQAINNSTKKITLKRTNTYTSKKITDSDLTTYLDKAVDGVNGREQTYFSLINKTHYAFCGIIKSYTYDTDYVYITYEPTTTHGTVTSRTDPWWVLGGSSVWNDRIFWIPEIPEFGYDLTAKYDLTGIPEGTPRFGAAFAFGRVCMSAAQGSFCAGDAVVAGGDYAAVFGTDNFGAYGNIVSGRENLSTGLHSALLGRALKNHGDYNALFGNGNTIQKGNYNLVAGSSNSVSNINNIVSGDGNVVSGMSSAVFGIHHYVKGNHVLTTGTGHDVDHGHSAYIGYKLKSTRSGQLIVGQFNELTAAGNVPDLFVVAYGSSADARKNLFTVNHSGEPEKGTDAVTFDYLKKYVKESTGASVSPTVTVTAVTNGYMLTIWDAVNDKRYVYVYHGTTPSIGADGYWYLGTKNTGVRAKGFEYSELTAAEKEELKGPPGDTYTITPGDYDAIANTVLSKLNRAENSEVTF